MDENGRDGGWLYAFWTQIYQIACFWIFWSVFPPSRRPPKPRPFKSEVEHHTIRLLQTTSFCWTFGRARCISSVREWCELGTKKSKAPNAGPANPGLARTCHFCILLHCSKNRSTRGNAHGIKRSHVPLHHVLCYRWSWIYLSFLFHSMA